MIYKVCETNGYSEDEKPPCKNAFKHEFEWWSVRTCTEEWFNDMHSHREGLWADSGSQHHITKEGYIAKLMDKKDTYWAIEINSIEELQDFIKENGEIVMSKDYRDCFEIEIYNGYRE